MEPIQFPEVNVQVAEKQTEFKTLPSLYDAEHGHTISCWTMGGFWTWEGFKARLHVFLTGKIWVSQLTGDGPVQPLLLFHRKDEIIEE